MRERAFTWIPVLVALGLALVGDYRFTIDPPGGYELAKWWWVGALGVLFVGALLPDDATHLSPRKPWTRTETLALLSVLLAAAAFRLWRITEYPPPDGFGFEEYQTGGLAYHTYVDWTWSLEFPLTNFLPGVAFRLFGLSSYTLRLPFLISGIVGPVFLFLALRRLVSLPAAWAAAFLLATNRWAASAARFADEIYFPLSIVAASYWLAVCVVQRPRRRTAFVLGLVSSDLFYAYSGYRFFPLIAYAGALCVAMAGWRRGRSTRGALRVLVTIGAVWVVVLSFGVMQAWLLPGSVLLEAVQRHQDTWRERAASDTNFIARLQFTLVRLRLGWELFATTGETMAWLNVPFDPMFDVVSAALGSLAVIWTLLRSRDTWRAIWLVMFVVPFGVLSVIATNYNVERYFVFLVPLFVMMAYLLDDVLRWHVLPASWRRVVIVALVSVCVVLNARALQTVIDSPAVQASFRNSENAVLAAIHRVPPGSRVVLLTWEGSNAFEPSDYRFLSEHATGGRPGSLPTGMAVDPTERRRVYWITEGALESDVLPELVQLVCPQAQFTSMDANAATVRSAWVSSPGECRPLPPVGLRATYRVTEKNGAVRELTETDPVLFAYTVPWELILKLVTEQVSDLHARWDGQVAPKGPGPYRFEVQAQQATATLQVDDREVSVTAPGQEWQGAELTLPVGSEPLRIRVTLDTSRPVYPRLRLLWTPPGEAAQVIQPKYLQPAASPPE